MILKLLWPTPPATHTPRAGCTVSLHPYASRGRVPIVHGGYQEVAMIVQSRLLEAENVSGRRGRPRYCNQHTHRRHMHTTHSLSLSRGPAVTPIGASCQRTPRASR